MRMRFASARVGKQMIDAPGDGGSKSAVKTKRGVARRARSRHIQLTRNRQSNRTSSTSALSEDGPLPRQRIVFGSPSRRRSSSQLVMQRIPASERNVLPRLPVRLFHALAAGGQLVTRSRRDARAQTHPRHSQAVGLAADCSCRSFASSWRGVADRQSITRNSHRWSSSGSRHRGRTCRPRRRCRCGAAQRDAHGQHRRQAG